MVKKINTAVQVDSGCISKVRVGEEMKGRNSPTRVRSRSGGSPWNVETMSRHNISELNIHAYNVP
jgi:hypothetical protein